MPSQIFDVNWNSVHIPFNIVFCVAPNVNCRTHLLPRKVGKTFCMRIASANEPTPKCYLRHRVRVASRGFYFIFFFFLNSNLFDDARDDSEYRISKKNECGWAGCRFSKLECNEKYYYYIVLFNFATTHGTAACKLCIGMSGLLYVRDVVIVCNAHCTIKISVFILLSVLSIRPLYIFLHSHSLFIPS